MPAVKIITTYEVVQGMLRYLGGLYLVLSLSLIFFGAAGLQALDLHSTRVRQLEPNRRPASAGAIAV